MVFLLLQFATFHFFIVFLPHPFQPISSVPYLLQYIRRRVNPVTLLLLTLLLLIAELKLLKSNSVHLDVSDKAPVVLIYYLVQKYGEFFDKIHLLTSLSQKKDINFFQYLMCPPLVSITAYVCVGMDS